MKASTKRIAKGMFLEVRGTAKRVVGALILNRILGAKGNVERIAGKVQKTIGKVQGTCGF